MKSRTQFRLFSKNVLFLLLLIVAWVFFEFANYKTTEYAVRDLMGYGFVILGLQWPRVVAIAFSLVDFVGIARGFTPEEGENEPKEIITLYFAWLIAALMNAGFSWWAFSVQIEVANPQHVFIDMGTVKYWAPIALAVIMFIVRVAIVGTIAFQLDRTLHPATTFTPQRKKRTASTARTRRASLTSKARTEAVKPRVQSTYARRAGVNSPLPVTPSKPTPHERDSDTQTDFADMFNL